ncbi:MAG: transcriptional regulator NrdR [Opitutales bacterium]
MQCPKCASPDTKVLDTRVGKDNLTIRRRRQCLRCDFRFTTLEEILREGIIVIKRGGQQEEFDRQKLLQGIRKATEKRPIQAEQIEMMVAEILDRLEREYDRVIPTEALGQAVMDGLKAIDHIAYVRYACVYKDFRDLDELEAELRSLRPSFTS